MASNAPQRGLPRLFVKYWWQLILALGVPLVAAVGLEAWSAYRAQLEQVKRTQAVQALALASAVESSLQRETQYAARLYRTPWPDRRLERLADDLELAISLFPAILQAQVVKDGAERLFVAQAEPRRVAEAADADAPLAGTTPANTFTPVRLGLRTIPALLVGIAHDRRAGERLEVALDLRSISDVLGQAARLDGSTIYAVSGDGSLVAHSDPAFALREKSLSAVEAVVEARRRSGEALGGLSLEARGAEGEAVLTTVQAIADTGWLLVIERPLEAAVAPVRREVWRALGMLAVALAIASLVAMLLARRLTRPVLTLGRDVERIGRGELTHRTAIRTGDEIESLGGQVNEMAARLEEYTHGLEQKVAEQTTELRKALALANDAMRARAVFLAAASHDLRQPLYAISILSDALAGATLPAESRAVLDKQRQAIAVLRTLFDNLLDLSRLDAGEVRPMLRSVSLREVLAPLADEYQALAVARGLAWRDDIKDAWVETDPELLHRVAANLLSNAVRYTERGHVELAAWIEEGRAMIRVADTGIGIAPEDQARVFEEFVQLRNEARDRERGVGLGLSIVRKIARLLDMRIDLASVPGEGTRVTFSIPVSATTPVEREPVAVAEGEGGEIAGKRVWIVEDDAMVRDALGVQFDAWGVDHDFALSRGELAALRAADGGWPDAVMLDDMLGSDDGGLELARWLAGEMEASRLAIVTGNVQPARLAELEASGIRILRKPLSSAEIAAWLRSATAEGDAPRPAPSAARAG